MQKHVILTLFLCVLYSFVTVSIAQNVEVAKTSTLDEADQPYLTTSMTLVSNETYYLDAGQQVTSIKISSTDTLSNHIYLSIGEETYTICMNTLEGDIALPSSFIIPLQPFRYFKLAAKKLTTVKVEFFYAPSIGKPSSVSKTKKALCEKPSTIAPEQWRRGLPDPKPGRNTSQINHCIIHHSAGNTQDTNYTNIIRNIYLLHTQSNGWDDIGYNYLIAKNGQIYSGRDPLGEGEEDNIQGAHFCGKNSGTMGICLLGNYEVDTPSRSLIQSLEQLLTWKLYKENLSALDSTIHPLNGSEYVATIGQHKDGCSTLCPGKNTSSAMKNIRRNVQIELDKCSNVVSVSERSRDHGVNIYPNPSDGYFFVTSDHHTNLTHYEIINSTGKLLERKPLTATGMIKIYAPSGLYTLVLWSDNSLITRKKIVVR